MEGRIKYLREKARGRLVFLCFLLFPAGSVVGFIISTELMIKANTRLVLPGENQWSLGNTFAVILVLPNAWMVLKCAWIMFKGLHEPGSRAQAPSGTGLHGIVDRV